MPLIELLRKGGPVMVPIVALSVIGLAVFLERLWATRRRRVVDDGLVRALVALLEQGRWAEAEAQARRSDTVAGHVFAVGFQHRGAPRSLVKEVMEEEAALHLAGLERYTGVVATVATVSPLLGLLGTITGMIRVFRDIASQANPQVSALAGGIWEALVTTAAGLTVAIPAYAMHRYLMGRLDRLEHELADGIIQVADAMASGPRAEEATEPRPASEGEAA